MKFYGDITKRDDEQRMVYGYASTEAVDHDGEVILRSAIEGALEDYMKFANIREMHQPSAVGIAKEASVDDKGLYIAAKVVDDSAWAKVVEGVYKGFSIGGRVLERDAKVRKTITKIGLSEISLVDRPANPEATFDVWKAVGIEEELMTPEELAKAEAEALAKAEAEAAAEADALAKAAAEEEAAAAALAAAEAAAEEDPVAKAEAALAELKAVVDAHTAPAAEDDVAKGLAALEELAKADATLAPLVELVKAAQVAKDEAAAALATAEAAKAVVAEDLVKSEAKSDTLAKALGSLTEQVGALTKRMTDMEAQPLPSKTATVHAVAKAADAAGAAARETPELSDEEVAKVLAEMSPEDRAMALMKATHRLPIAVRN